MPTIETKNILSTGVGRRKSASAFVQIVSGNGEIVVNQQPGIEYFHFNSQALSICRTALEIFDSENGLVMLGRAYTAGATEKILKVAEVRFEVLKNETTLIDAYDYRTDLSGKTSANIVYEGTPYNVMLKPVNPVLIIQ